MEIVIVTEGQVVGTPSTARKATFPGDRISGRSHHHSLTPLPALPHQTWPAGPHWARRGLEAHRRERTTPIQCLTPLLGLRVRSLWDKASMLLKINANCRTWRGLNRKAF